MGEDDGWVGRGQVEEAISTLNRVLAVDPHEANALFTLGQIAEVRVPPHAITW